MVPRGSPRAPRAPKDLSKTPLASHLGPKALEASPNDPKMTPKWHPEWPKRLQNDGQFLPVFTPIVPHILQTRSPNELPHTWANALCTFAHLSLSTSAPTAEAQKPCKNHRFFIICGMLRPLDDPQPPVQRGRGRR